MTTLAFPTVVSKPASLPAWQRVWRRGFAPHLSPRALELLARALVLDDPRVLQGATLQPAPLPYLADWQAEGADPVAFALWQANGLETVGEVEAAWAWTCAECDRLLGLSGACGHFFQWWDGVPRDVARAALVKEINRVLRLAA